MTKYLDLDPYIPAEVLSKVLAEHQALEAELEQASAKAQLEKSHESIESDEDLKMAENYAQALAAGRLSINS